MEIEVHISRQRLFSREAVCKINKYEAYMHIQRVY